MIERPVVDAPRRARRAFSPRNDLHRDSRSRCWQSDRAAVLRQGKHPLSLDPDRDVLAVDDEAVEHRIPPRRLQPLQHLRERLLAGRVGREVCALRGPRERQHPLHHVSGKQLSAQLDQLVASHRAQPRAQLGGDLRGGIHVEAFAAHDPKSAGRWHPIVVAPEKSAPASAASRRSTPISIARAKEAAIRLAPRMETSMSLAPEKSAFSSEVAPKRASAKTVRTISAPSNFARYSLVSSKRATDRLAPEKIAFIASQPWIFSRRPLSCAAPMSYRSQE